MRFAVTAVIFLSTLFSCQKELSYENPANGGNSNGGNSNSKGDFRAKINGTQWVANDSSKGATILDGVINIIGIGNNYDMINITLIGSNTGTYILNSTTANIALYQDGSSSNPFVTNGSSNPSQAGGTVTITEIDTVSKTISGTFQFNLYRQSDQSVKNITEGSFTKIPYIASLPPAKITDTMVANISGINYNWIALSLITGTNPNSTQLFINGSNYDASHAVGLFMPYDITPGSYTLDYTGNTYIGEYSPDASTFYISQTGTLTILAHDLTGRRIKGNFNFTGYTLDHSDSVQITNGYFSVGY